ncbi:MAG: hypothetical protein R6W96_00695 [Clostridia bacterium]
MTDEDRKKALDAMGLSEEASRKDIESRYVAFLKRRKNREELDYDGITKAYNQLMGIEEEHRPQSWLRKKYKAFMFNHFGMAVVVVIALGILFSVVYPALTKKTPDLSISFVGNFNIFNQALEEKIRLEMPHLEYLIVETIYVSENSESGEFDEAGRIQLAGLILTGETGVIVASDTAYQFLLANDALAPLEETMGEVLAGINPDKYIYAIDPVDREKKVFGVNVSENGLFYKSISGSVARILCLTRDFANPENVLEAIKIILEEE